MAMYPVTSKQELEGMTAKELVALYHKLQKVDLVVFDELTKTAREIRIRETAQGCTGRIDEGEKDENK